MDALKKFVFPALVCLSLATSALGQDKQDQRIVSLRMIKGQVFASAHSVIYRADLTKKKWTKLQGPGVPEPRGLFAMGSTEDKALFYFVTPSGMKKTALNWQEKLPAIKKPGFYRSTNLGTSWQLMNEKYDFVEVKRVARGRMFGVMRGNEYEKILFSNDDGKTWKDINNAEAKESFILHLIRDPNDPGMVCLFTPFTLRRGGIIYQARDDTFAWKMCYSGLAPEFEWPKDELKSEKEFFATHFSPGYRLEWPTGSVKKLAEEFPRDDWHEKSTGVSTIHHVGARLDNYFQYPFKDQTVISTFYLAAEKAFYELEVNQPLVVNVSLTLLGSAEEKIVRKLVDADSVTVFWGIRVIDPDGQKHTIKHNLNDPLGHVKNKKLTLADSQKNIMLKTFPLSTRNPYHRTINLGALMKFEKLGTYRVQLIYRCGPWRDQVQVLRSMDALYSEPFTVFLKAKS